MQKSYFKIIHIAFILIVTKSQKHLASVLRALQLAWFRTEFSVAHKNVALDDNNHLK